MPGWIVDIFGHIIFWIGIPALFIVSASAPFFVVKKVLKRKFTLLNFLVSMVVAAGLIAVDTYILYQGILWLAGLAACDLYGC